ncbi:lipopolysaccharide biosynthesis protein [Levilactobacillus bambusae]|uniref:Flippase n=1 Tax=Levilactobacillus bambusae TaxID=2024736 RepID=A0A2V1MZS8_9LACO|nr:lipopolysaccharide biosynthesis protein [Levilactobacillus bambusae]PWF99664.1 flippase [Levilactobacillus bambusae]
MGQPNQLRRQTIAGFLFTGVELVGNQGLRLAIQILLARLLVPADFGLIGMLMVFTALSQSLIDSGFQNALIREDRVTPAAYATVFWFNIGLSVGLYAVLYLSAPAIAGFYRTPDLVMTLRVMEVILPINALSLISRTILTRQMAFKAQMKINLVSSLIAGIVAVGLALNGFGVWSMVWQMIIGQLLQTVGFLKTAQWHPVKQLDLKALSRLFSFGWKLTLAGLINTLYNNLLTMIIGRFYSVTTLGYFTNAQKISQSVTDTSTMAIQKVSYPAFSQQKADLTALKHGYQKVILHAVYLLFPVLVGVGLLSDQILGLVFGPQWLPAAQYLMPLCLAGLFFPLQALNLNILQVVGRSDWNLRLEFVEKGSGLLLFGTAFLLHLSLAGLMWLLVAHAAFSYLVDAAVAGRFIQFGALAQLKSGWRITLLVVGMGIGVKGLTVMLPMSWWALGIEILVGIGLYVGGSWLMRLHEFHSCWQMVNRLLAKRRGLAVD